ncbi:hypothetical protein JY452_07105 [Stenotrophomonas maltophilia]|nr:hypothetical protein [Stenotrophomonas maltophilia]MBN5083734.1 hypothetical protein [Stenotrophomonas maltophilia]MBN5100446.1 hypothetical protein [Stenotrophomonas maltophilia]MBN5125760.1 hypothetical protein [Stenotrophomonas maltophilia]
MAARKAPTRDAKASRPKLLQVRVLLGETGFEARPIGYGEGTVGKAATSSMSVRNLARELGYQPGFDARYDGKAADGVGTIWSIVEVTA